MLLARSAMASRRKTRSTRTTSTKKRRKTSSRRSKKAASTRGTRTKKASSRRYGARASKKVERSMRELKRGELRSGRSGKKVTSRKQAIAIGLSEARREGAKVPPPRKKATRRRSVAAAR
jgi:hypothetical protein